MTTTLALLGLLAACGTPGQDLRVDVTPAPVLPVSYPVGEEVGRLLSSDPSASEGAEARLIALDGERRDQLLSYAKTLPRERDLRWLHVLDEHHALPQLTADERMEFLLWKTAKPERSYAMKAQSGLMDMATSAPQTLIARVREGGPGTDIVAVVLGVTGTRQAVPALLDRYRDARTRQEREAVSEALGMLWGTGRKPRVVGAPAEIARDADMLEAWYREQLELEAEAAAATGPVEGSP